MGRTAHLHTGIYTCQMRKVDQYGQPCSGWQLIIESSAFEPIFEDINEMARSLKRSVELELTEFRILNPYRQEVACLSPLDYSWIFQKDDYAEHDLVDNIDEAVDALSIIKRRQLLYGVFTIANSICVVGLAALLLTGS